MAITISNPDEARSFSIGPLKMQLKKWASSDSADTSVVVTADNMHRVDFAILTGAIQTGQVSVSGNVATFTVAQTDAQDGQVILLGK